MIHQSTSSSNSSQLLSTLTQLEARLNIAKNWDSAPAKECADNVLKTLSNLPTGAQIHYATKLNKLHDACIEILNRKEPATSSPSSQNTPQASDPAPTDGSMPAIAPTQKPIGLVNESGNDCFANAARQLFYGTSLAKHTIEKLSASTDNTLFLKEDMKHYLEGQAADKKSINGAKLFRDAIGIDASDARGRSPSSGPMRIPRPQRDTYDAIRHVLGMVPSGESEKGKKLIPEHLKRGTRNPIQNWIEINTIYTSKTYDDPRNAFAAIEPESRESLKLQEDGSIQYTGYDLPLSIELPMHRPDSGNAKSLDDALNNYFNPYFDTNSASDIQRGRVSLTPTHESFRFLDTPDHLLFSLKRFNANNEKINTSIEIDQKFTLDERHVKNGSAEYEIEAFITHEGNSTKEGHYISYIRKATQWYYISDSDVKPISSQEAKNAMKTAYIFYANKLPSPTMLQAAAQMTGTVTYSLVTLPFYLISAIFNAAYSWLPSWPNAKSVDVIDIPTVPMPAAPPPRQRPVFGKQTPSSISHGSYKAAPFISLGFLAKALNGEVLTKSSLKALMKEGSEAYQAQDPKACSENLLKSAILNVQNAVTVSSKPTNYAGIRDTQKRQSALKTSLKNVRSKPAGMLINYPMGSLSVIVNAKSEFQIFNPNDGRIIIEKNIDTAASRLSTLIPSRTSNFDIYDIFPMQKSRLSSLTSIFSSSHSKKGKDPLRLSDRIKVTSNSKTAMQSQLIDFYQNGKSNAHGVTLKQIMQYSDQEMEAHHDFIQWIFPTFTQSAFNSKAPILTKDLADAFKSNKTCRDNLLMSFKRMLKYYGMTLNWRNKVVKAGIFNDRKGKRTGHNLQRMTRIIESMAVLGRPDLAKNFYDFLMQISKEENFGTSPAHWTKKAEHLNLTK